MAAPALYLATLLPFLAMEAVWLRLVVRPLFERHVGALLLDEPRWAAAAAFYLLHVAGIVHFAGLPALREGGPAQAAAGGAVLGLLVYGVYETVNMATLKGWSWSMVALDAAGGAALSALAAAFGVWSVRALGVTTP